MNRKFTKLIIAFTVSAGVFSAQFLSTAVDASASTFHPRISEDCYQKSISKGFLGKSYGVGKNQYVCNTYVEKALESLETVSPKESASTGIKNIRIHKGKKATPTSYDWASYRVKISYKTGVLDEETNTYQWTSSRTTSIQRHSKGTSLSSLELGDVLTYGNGGGHVALYFGEYDSMEDVAARLTELGVYQKSDLKKRSDRYVNRKGRPIIRCYAGCGTKWRIHATSKGLLIDNAIVSRRSNGTSSFGKWSKTIASGFIVYNELIATES